MKVRMMVTAIGAIGVLAAAGCSDGGSAPVTSSSPATSAASSTASSAAAPTHPAGTGGAAGGHQGTQGGQQGQQQAPHTTTHARPQPTAPQTQPTKPADGNYNGKPCTPSGGGSGALTWNEETRAWQCVPYDGEGNEKTTTTTKATPTTAPSDGDPGGTPCTTANGVPGKYGYDDATDQWVCVEI